MTGPSLSDGMVGFGLGGIRLSFYFRCSCFGSGTDGKVVAFPGDYDKWKNWLYT